MFFLKGCVPQLTAIHFLLFIFCTMLHTLKALFFYITQTFRCFPPVLPCASQTLPQPRLHRPADLALSGGTARLYKKRALDLAISKSGRVCDDK